MKVHNNLAHAAILSLMLCFVALPTHAGMWDDPKNLKVLSEDITPDELRAAMRGFAGNTGSRCSTCHVGTDENDLRTYDFSLDDKEEKRKARKMIKLVNDINSYLIETLHASPDEMVRVDCATCHRGQAKPEMLQDVLASAYENGGLVEATDKYRVLRDRYYGGYTFDFSEKVLMITAESMAKDDELDAALGFLDLNLEFYPESARSFVLQAQVLTTKNDIPAARLSFLRALAIEPDNNRTQRLLAALPD